MLTATAVYVPLAQLVEHSTFNRKVSGSNPEWHTSHYKKIGGKHHGTQI